MEIDLLNVTKKLRRRYKRDSIQNDILYDNLVHFNNFLHCNNIDKNINQILADETIEEKEKRLTELFPSINKNTDHEFNDALSTIEKMNLYFSIIPFNEYLWLKKIISITENIPICITVSSAKKETFGFPLFM